MRSGWPSGRPRIAGDTLLTEPTPTTEAVPTAPDGATSRPMPVPLVPGVELPSDSVRYRLKNKLLGPPLHTEQLAHERLGKPTALAVFASDNLSSSAYATEEILRVLLISGGVGALAFARVVPITIALLAVLGVLLFSYRQTIKAYPQAGGAYLVTRDNFGILPAQVAGVALLTDYILTVSVSVSAGTAALTSVFEGLFPWRVLISVGFVLILMWMGITLGVMFFGLSVLAAHMHVVPDPEEKVTVLAQVAKAAFGAGAVGNVAFILLQVATMLILVLAANTSYADFPRLASFHAGDSFLPRQLTRYGDRLVFSNGIIALSLLGGLLVIVFKASVTRLIPLYAIGVFTSFTFSQLGMAKRHLTLREPKWRVGLAFNGLGGGGSGIMTVIIAATKLSQGARIILITIPVMLAGLLRVNKHYKQVKVALADPSRSPSQDLPRQTVVIPVGEPGPND